MTALRYVLWSNGVLGADAHGSLPTTIRPAAEVARWVLVIVTLSAVAKARARHVRSSLFVGMLAASAASSMVASYGSADGAGLVVIALAALLGAVALHAAIGMAAEVRRIEISR